VRADADEHTAGDVRSEISTHVTGFEKAQMARTPFRCQLLAHSTPFRIEKARAGVYPSTFTRSKVPIVIARKAAHLVLTLGVLVGGASCLDVTGNDVADSQIRIVNASGQTLNIFLDDHLSIDGSVPPNISLIVVQSGEHTLTVRTANGVDTPLTFTTTPGGMANTYAYTTSEGVVNLVLMDTTVAPTGSAARVRAINLSQEAGDVDIYASQPSGTAGTQLAPTFGYLATTPYLEKSAGTWEVYLTTLGTTTKLRSTGSFDVEGGGRRTIVILDSLSVPVFRILPN
jgi:hypothetical protein